MKKHLIIALLTFTLTNSLFATARIENKKSNAIFFTSEYETNVTFPANYAVGDYVEFVQLQPIAAGASGYYNISITYTRYAVASAATHVAAISHSNPALWRETGRINNNKYVFSEQSFTIDCNTEYANPRFRIRAIGTYGAQEQPLTVYIKVTSINLNGAFTPLNATGNDLTVNKFLPMTNEWDLYVGHSYSYDGASIAIKALANGNIGIGTTTPDEKLAVNGKIHTKEVRVDMIGWPDYVFERNYNLVKLDALESYIKKNKHLPNMPSAKEAEKQGVELGNMVKQLLKNQEELTLHLIKIEKENKKLKKACSQMKREINNIKTKK